MKILMVALTLLFTMAPMVHAETVNVFGGGSDDSRVIITTTDDGDSRSDIANRISDQ